MSRAAPDGGPPQRTLQRVREVVSGRGFRRYFAARTVSQLGDGIFQLAAADILVFRSPGANPALKLALITAITLVPFSAVAPFTGVFIDRWERRKILTYTPAVRAVLAALAVASGNAGVVFGLIVLLVLSSNRFFLATMGAVLPQLVPTEDLLEANSISTTGGSVANVAGLGIGSAVSALFGETTTVVVAACAFTAAALLARRVHVHRGFIPDRAPLLDEAREVVHEMIDGLRLIRRSERVVYALSSVTVVQVLVGAVSGAVAYYFIAVLRLEVGSVTLLLASLAAGIGVGVVLVPFAARYVRRDRLIPIAYVIAGVAVFATGLRLSRTAVVVGAMFAGMSYAFAKIPVDTIVQEEMPDAFRGRAFAAYDMVFNLARVAGIALIALALEVLAPATGMLAIGLVYATMAVVFARWEKRLPGEDAEPGDYGLDDVDAGPGDPGWPDPQYGPEPAGGRPSYGDADVSSERMSEPDAPQPLLQPGELVVVRSYAGSRAEEEPRALVVAGREIPVESVEWRAVEERGGERRRVFVLRAGGARVRISSREDSARWEVERLLPARPGAHGR